MIIKKFTAKTEEEATKNAKAELGASAVIMNVRTVKGKGLFSFLKKPLIEVTAAVEEEKDTVVSQTKPPQGIQRQGIPPERLYKDVIPDDAPSETRNPKEENPDGGVIEQKLESIHSLIEQQLKTVKEQQDEDNIQKDDRNDESNDTVINFLKLIYNTLIENEVDEKYANELVDEITKLNKPGISIDYLLSNIYQKLILKFGLPREIAPASEGPKTVFFIGPTGVGKTTTIAKIASRFCVNEKKRVALVTTDTYRIKAAEQLRTYADILEIPFRVAYNEDDLVQSVEDLKDYDYIFVDTAGYSPHDDEKCNEMKQLLTSARKLAQTETFLVLSTTTKYRDLRTIADIYREITEYSLIFTKLDETDAYGNILNIKIHTGADISYVTDGQDVPDDIEIFNPQAIVKSILGGRTGNGEA